MLASWSRPVTVTAHAVLLVFAVVPVHTTAFAQGKLEARYTMAIAGIAIGKSEITADIGKDQYIAIAGGRASGFLRILLSGEGNIIARGKILDGHPIPTEFSASLKDEDESSRIEMILDAGNVKELSAEFSLPETDRLPVTENQRKGIIDPLSALLVPASGPDGLSSTACQRTLPIFDGRRRYDLTLTFKRMAAVKMEKGYQGPVLVCAVVFLPIAGHRTNSTLAKYLSEGRDIELWLAPIAGTRVLAPLRLSIANLIGNMVIDATQFETAATAPARATLTTP